MKTKNAYLVTLSTEIEVVIESDMPIDENHVDETCDKQEAICETLALTNAPRLDLMGWRDEYKYAVKSTGSKIARCQLKELDIENTSGRNSQ